MDVRKAKLACLLFTALLMSTHFAHSQQSCGTAISKTSSLRQVDLKVLHGETIIQQEYYGLFNSEFSPKAQAIWTQLMTNEWSAVMTDPTQRLGKVKMHRRLGFELLPDGSVQAPSYLEFVQNFLRQISSKNKLPLPSVVLVKDVRRGLQDYLLVAPGVDPWPTEPGYRFLSSVELFNIPFRAVLSGLRRQRFPLLEQPHDVAHFVSFLMNRKFAESLLVQIEKLPILEKYPIGLSRRLFYVLELLSLANPAKKNEISELLKFPWAKEKYSKRPFTEFAKYFESLPISKVNEQAARILEAYSSLMVDFGGATVRSFEKINLPNDFSSLDEPTGALFHFVAKRRNTLTTVVFDELSTNPIVILRFLLKMHKLSEEDFNSLINKNRYFRNFFKESDEPSSPLKPDYRERLESLIRLHVARMEFVLWETSHSITAEKWIAETLVPVMDSQSEVLDFTRNVFGEESILYKSMIEGSR